MKILICDDDKTHLINEKNYVTENEKEFTVECFENGTEIMEYLSTDHKDVAAVLMDIELGKDNGIAVAENICTLYPQIKIIFLTAYSIKYCEEIFLAGKNLVPFALVDKTNLITNLKRAFDKMRNAENSMTEKISIKTKNETFIIDLKETLYLSSDAHRLIVVEREEKKEIHYKLSDALKLLPTYYIQCHKSFVVNAFHVTSYNFKQIVLDNKEIIPVSRKYSQSMRNEMLKTKCDLL